LFCTSCIGQRAMNSYPPDFASKIKALAHDVGFWVAAQATRSATDADRGMKSVDDCRCNLAEVGVLDAALCHQLRDIAVAAAAVTLCTTFEMSGLEDCKADFAAACEPRPREVAPDLWRRTQDFFWSAARLACAELRGNATAVQQEQHVYDRQARQLAGLKRLGTVRLPPESHRSFSDEAARLMPATVVMLSTCREAQVQSPRTPFSGAVEGRCTELLLKSLAELESRSWIELLWAMRRLVGSSRQADRQVPVLSCSRRMDLNAPFGVRHPKPSGRCRALLVGIDYIGQDGLEMSVGHTDVAGIRKYLLGQGFNELDMRVLVDDGKHDRPEKAAIEAGMTWLVKGASPGDSLFFLYSGHGCSYVGEGEDEDPSRGCDEALCPVNFRSAGMIFDDEVYRFLVAPLQEGVLLTCIIDCCQSGTVLHLPYAFSADEERLASVKGPGEATGEATCEAAAMQPNAEYDPGKMLQVIQHHPAMCVAATFWAEELAAMNPSRHRASLGGALAKMAHTAQSWASG